MFVITGGSDSNITLTDEAPASPSNNAVGLYVEPHSRRAHAFEPVREISTGPIDRLHAMDDLLDSCVMFYYGVAHKYIIMVYEHKPFCLVYVQILIAIESLFFFCLVAIKDCRVTRQHRHAVRHPDRNQDRL